MMGRQVLLNIPILHNIFDLRIHKTSHHLHQFVDIQTHWLISVVGRAAEDSYRKVIRYSIKSRISRWVSALFTAGIAETGSVWVSISLPFTVTVFPSAVFTS